MKKKVSGKENKNNFKATTIFLGKPFISNILRILAPKFFHTIVVL
jgi:hypothetical protein